MAEWHSVSEFAALTGRTRQTIYQQAKEGRLRPYTRKVSGKLKIKAEALSLFDREKPGTEQEPKPMEPEGIDKAGTDQERAQQEPGTGQEQQQRDPLVDILLRELAIKNQQIEQLQQALRREQESLRVEQSIRTSLESRILTIEAHEAEKAENTAQESKEPLQDELGRSEGVPAQEHEPEEPQKGWKMFIRRFRRP